MSEKRENWGSRIGFILAAAGFSIGLGNIWRFPYLVSTNGGGAFVLAYVLICIFIGVPIFLQELSIGRRTKRTPVTAFTKLNGDKPTVWNVIGWIGALACVILMAYYTIIIGWMLRYAVKASTGIFTNVDLKTTTAMFADFMKSPVELLSYGAVVFIALGLTVSRGLKDGVEKVCKWLLPILACMIVILAIHSLMLTPQGEHGKTALEGLKWYLTPDFAKLAEPEVWLRALGQSFFSIGIGIATAVVYGSYLHDDSDMPQDCCYIIAMDTGFALIAGVVIFPALACYGGDMSVSGSGLVMEMMPVIFGQMPGGTIWASMFFFLAAIAGFTSGIGYLEAPVACFAEFFKTSRKTMTWIVIGIMFALSIPATLGCSVLSHITIKGMNLFDFFDYLSGNIMMPVDALLIAIYVAFVWKFESYREEANKGAKTAFKVGESWKYWVTYAVPLVLIVILYRNI